LPGPLLGELFLHQGIVQGAQFAVRSEDQHPGDETQGGGGIEQALAAVGLGEAHGGRPPGGHHLIAGGLAGAQGLAAAGSQEQGQQKDEEDWTHGAKHEPVGRTGQGDPGHIQGARPCPYLEYQKNLIYQEQP
ncbi:MAG: hypothetical protein DI538_28060, partial [Azospira oryzae]